MFSSLHTKALNREVFYEAFGIKTDDDFALHETADLREARDWKDGRGTGPDPDDLRFDMMAKYHSPWNLTVIEILTNMLSSKVKEVRHLPECPDDYYRKIIVEKYQRCRTIWKKSRPRLDEDGTLETAEDMEKRMVKDKDLDLKDHRQATRRRSVRVLSSLTIH